MAWVMKRTTSKGQVRYQALYRDPTGAKRSAGSFTAKAEAERAGTAAEIKVLDGSWLDRKLGEQKFRDYVENSWWPNQLHLELSTRAGYRSILDKHFLPYFGEYPLNAISPSVVQGWVAHAHANGLSPRSIRKDHTLLVTIFKATQRDRLLLYNPCEQTRLPKVVVQRREVITPAQLQQLLDHLPEQHQVLVLVAIETGMRWGELAALRPRHLDLQQCEVTVKETIVEIGTKNSPTGDRYTVKPMPKGDRPRQLKITPELTAVLDARISQYGIRADDLLFPSTLRDLQQPTSRNTFRTRVWRPALTRAKLPLTIRMHDLRHAHASWMLAGGADLKTVMDRLGHRQITTTQGYLHALQSADQNGLEAFRRIRDTGAERE